MLIASEGYALYEPWSHTHPGLPFSLMSTYPNSRDCQLCVPPQPAFGLNRLSSLCLLKRYELGMLMLLSSY